MSESSSFDAAFTPDDLERRYQELRARHWDVVKRRTRISSGSDRVQLREFEEQVGKHLRAASRKVREGRYTFAPVLEKEIPKKAGSAETRTISVATIRDSIVQRALYEHAYPEIERHLLPCAYGYRRRHNAHDAVKHIQGLFRNGMTWVFDADIRSFFDNVDHAILLDRVDALDLDKRAATLIRRFLSTRRVKARDARTLKAQNGKMRRYPTTERRKGVPQGGVLSGMLTNLYLAEFDRSVSSRFEGFVRYADDFVICCSSPDECNDARAHVEALLRDLGGLELHPEKTSTVVDARVRGVEFLGFEITPDRVRVRAANVEKFRNRIREVIASHKARKTPEATLRSLCDRLAYKIRGPTRSHMEELIDMGLADHPDRRSWIGFFRIVDDRRQIQRLDTWIRAQVSRYMWDTHRSKVRLHEMRAARLPSLCNQRWRARRPAPIRGARNQPVDNFSQKSTRRRRAH